MSQALRFSRLVHLSHPVFPGIPLWPGDPPVQIQPVASLEREGYTLRRLCIGEHSGTHLNAPASFYPDGETCSQWAAADLVLPLAVFDVRARAALDPDYRLQVADILAWEADHGSLPPLALACLLTGRGAFWRDPPRFFAYDGDGRMHYPAFGLEAAQFLLEDRLASGLGTDTHGLDPADDDSFAINRLVLKPGSRRVALECLANLDQVPPSGATVFVGALLLEGGTGCPAAVIAGIL